MPDSLSIAADSILADSLARVAAVEDSLRKCIHADYSLLDSLLEKNVAAAHGIYPAPKPYDATTDDGIVIAFLLTFVLIVVFLVQMRISRQAINKNLSTRLLDTPPAQLPSTLGGFFCLTAGISLGIGLVWVARSLNVALPSPFSQMGSLELSLIAGLVFWIYVIVKCTIYRIINMTFFSPVATKRWDFIQHSVIALSGVLFFALALLAVFLPLSFTTALFAAAFVVFLMKITLLVASFHTFFQLKVSVIHIILYFCTLEIIPLLLLAHAGGMFLIVNPM